MGMEGKGVRRKREEWGRNGKERKVERGGARAIY